MSRRMLPAVLAAIGALVVAGWFYVGTRQASDLAAAGTIVNAGDRLSAADARRARSLLDSAAFLNPNRQVELDRSRLELKTGHRTLAYRLSTAVTRAEPMNVLAWDYVFQSAPNQAARNEALARVAPLLPQSAR